MSPRRLRPRAFVALALFLGAGRAAALPLPLETSVEGAWLSLAVHDADVLVRYSPSAAPVLQAWCVSETGGGGELALERRLQGLTVTQPETGEVATCPRMRIEASLTPAQQLKIEGARLTVTVDDRETPTVRAPARGAEQAPSPARLELRLDASALTLLGAQSVRAVLAASWLSGDGLRGPVALTLFGGKAEIHGLEGDLGLEAEAAQTWIENLRGTLALRLQGGEFDLESGAGDVTGELTDASGRFHQWQGGLIVTAEGGQVEVRSATAPEAEVEILGRGTEALVDDFSGTLAVRLDGGSVVASRIEGEAKLDASHEAQINVAGLAGALSLSLTSGSSGNVRELVGNLKAQVEDGRLELAGVDSVDLSAARAEVVGTALYALPRADALGSRIDLDLSSVTANPRLVLKGASEARIRLPSPCIVRANAPGQFDSTRMEITGCDSNSPGQGQRTAALQRAHGGTATILAVGLDAASRLEVSAAP